MEVENLVSRTDFLALRGPAVRYVARSFLEVPLLNRTFESGRNVSQRKGQYKSQ